MKAKLGRDQAYKKFITVSVIWVAPKVGVYLCSHEAIHATRAIRLVEHADILVVTGDVLARNGEAYEGCSQRICGT
jgi:hypothetical protein